tara:strand:+ start:287 stop:781 length:495 start_codon:yes stop_codon:yes gene_type:complete
VPLGSIFFNNNKGGIMPKLSVREQQALTDTVVKRISDIQKTHAEHQFKEIKSEAWQYIKEYTDLEDRKKQCEHMMEKIKDKHSALAKRFNEGRKWVQYSSDYHSSYAKPSDKWGLNPETDYRAREEILREITVSQLITNEDIEKTIEQLVIKHQPLKAFKVVNG